MRHLIAPGALAGLLAAGGTALSSEMPDLRGNWVPSQGAHIVDGPSRHGESGTVSVPGHETAQTHASPFVFRFEGQEGRTFWGVLSSAKVSEKLIGALSVDGKRFVMVDHDGRFEGIVVDNDTLDYCYTHVTETDMAVACGLLVREE